MKRLIAVWLVILILIGGMIGFVNLSADAENGNGDAELRSGTQSKSGLTAHDPIYIDENTGFTFTNGVTSGTGVENDPYIIENWDIDATGCADGIYIGGTGVYFIIRNCVIHEGGVNNGMELCGVQNGKIDYVTFYNNYCGIFLDYSSSNKITNCTVHHSFLNGIWLKNSLNNQIANCTVYHNWGLTGGWGVLLDHSSNNSILNCAVYDNYVDGIFLKGSSDSQIINCDVYDNMFGIYLAYSSNNNQITNCDIYNNLNSGVRLDSSSDNEIHYCNIYGNTKYGVCNNNVEIQYQVDATYNWWGSTNGPGRDGANPVYGAVIYDHWLKKAGAGDTILAAISNYLPIIVVVAILLVIVTIVMKRRKGGKKTFPKQEVPIPTVPSQPEAFPKGK